ncbi:Oidioi.mRNA.OKI2018_I69.chr1.g1081.t1.cds [Oikopleura dioica]|uniref:Oidioi.mRNA.OKI2018_I69.chr1.g1081.t1.cds n=1 Tax=Oikopleura dioica TaxID=34765 RepID=A0ABN7SW19_OIKDI|nr:Oidioi.mRNA.OKI2018_I69.chr1.g1081.t1.cds [Oikopleura dioica]
MPPASQNAPVDSEDGFSSDEEIMEESGGEEDEATVGFPETQAQKEQQDWSRRTDTLFESAAEQKEAEERRVRIAAQWNEPLKDIKEESESNASVRMEQKEKAEAERRLQKEEFEKIQKLKQEQEDKARAREAIRLRMQRQVDENTRIRREYHEEIQRKKEEEEAQKRRLAQDKEAEERRRAAIKADEEKVLTKPEVGIRLVAETGRRGNHYHLSKKEAKLMSRISGSNFEEIRQAWFNSEGLLKFKDSKNPGHRHYKYTLRSGWTIKEGTENWKLDPVARLSAEERRVVHYLVESLNYQGIKRRFKEALDTGLLNPAKMDAILVFAYKICGGNLVHYVRFVFVRLFRLHDIPIPPVHSDAAPKPPRHY